MFIVLVVDVAPLSGKSAALQYNCIIIQVKNMRQYSKCLGRPLLPCLCDLSVSVDTGSRLQRVCSQPSGQLPRSHTQQAIFCTVVRKNGAVKTVGLNYDIFICTTSYYICDVSAIFVLILAVFLSNLVYKQKMSQNEHPKQTLAQAILTFWLCASRCLRTSACHSQRSPELQCTGTKVPNNMLRSSPVLQVCVKPAARRQSPGLRHAAHCAFQQDLSGTIPMYTHLHGYLHRQTFMSVAFTINRLLMDSPRHVMVGLDGTRSPEAGGHASDAPSVLRQIAPFVAKVSLRDGSHGTEVCAS